MAASRPGPWLVRVRLLVVFLIAAGVATVGCAGYVNYDAWLWRQNGVETTALVLASGGGACRVGFEADGSWWVGDIDLYRDSFSSGYRCPGDAGEKIRVTFRSDDPTRVSFPEKVTQDRIEVQMIGAGILAGLIAALVWAVRRWLVHRAQDQLAVELGASRARLARARVERRWLQRRQRHRRVYRRRGVGGE